MQQQKPRIFHVYIMASAPRGYLYVGQTSDIARRMVEHLNGLMPEGYTARRNINNLVYYEKHGIREEALKRESQLKRFTRASKFKLIEAENPTWQPLQVRVLERFS